MRPGPSCWWPLVVAVLLCAHWVWSAPAPAPAPSPVRYDQRQTGNLNVQVDLKDVEIYAILDDSFLSNFGGGDYDYDYSQMTEKPLNKPSNSTSTTRPQFNATTSTTTSTTTSPKTRANVPSFRPEEGYGKERSATASIAAEPEAAPMAPAAPPTSAPAPPQPRRPSVAHRRCGAGFHRDESGRCRRDRRPLRKHALRLRASARATPPAAPPAAPPAPASESADSSAALAVTASYVITPAAPADTLRNLTAAAPSNKTDPPAVPTPTPNHSAPAAAEDTRNLIETHKPQGFTALPKRSNTPAATSPQSTDKNKTMIPSTSLSAAVAMTSSLPPRSL